MDDKKPRWWKSLHDVSWTQVKSALVDDWHKLVAGTEKLEKGAAEIAIQFGHAAKEVYAKTGTWGVELEKELKKDWEETHKEAKLTWEQVREAVKHGWEKTTKKS